ncbi:hypothetical protein AA223_20005 [Salmonella enterica subsp. enterica serovar Newport]|nr:hypothetical protein [Salmonella enterica subsp. enterica serovar Newport]
MARAAKKRSDLNLYLIASFFALLRMVIPSAKCHANQCKTFRRATLRARKRKTLKSVQYRLKGSGPIRRLSPALLMA